MAFPITRSTRLHIQGTNSTGWVLDYPQAGDIVDGGGTTVEAGDLILIQIGRDGGGGTGTLSDAGYTKLHETAVGTAAKGLTFVKVADGSETGTVTYSPGATEQGVARIAVIKQWHGTISGGVEVSTRTTGLSTSPDPPSFTPSWGSADTLWRATVAFDDGRRSISAYPANYTLYQASDASNGSGGAGLGSAGRELAAATENPGAFTLNSSDDWVAWVVAIRGGVPPAPKTQSAYRFRDHANASAVLNDATFGVAQDTGFTAQVHRRFRLRTLISGGGTTSYKLQYRINAGAWADVAVNAPGNREAEVATSIAAVEIVENSGYADAEATSSLLTGGSGSFVAGTGKDLAINSGSIALGADGKTEVEWSLWINRWNHLAETAFVNAGDTIEFRVVEGSGTLLTYNVTPSLTVSIPAGHVAGGQWVENPAGVGPFKASSGDLYMISEPYEMYPHLVMWRSTDGGDTWTPTNMTGNPLSTDAEGVSVRQVGDILHIAHWGTERPSGNDGVLYHRFSMASNTWVEVDTAVDAPGGGLSRRDQAITMEVQSNGNVLIAYHYDATNWKVGYRRRVSGVWDTTTTLLWDSANGAWTGVTSVLDTDDDSVYLFAHNDATGALFGKMVNSSGSRFNLFADTETGAGTQVFTGGGTATTDEMNYVRPVFWNDGVKRVFIARRLDSNELLRGMRLRPGSGGSLGTEVTISGSHQVAYNRAASRQPTASLSRDPGTGKLFVVYGFTDLPPYGDPITLYSNESTDGGVTWGTPTLLTLRTWSTTVPYVSTNVFTHSAGNGGATVVGVVYYAASWYDEDDTTGSTTLGGHHGGYAWYDEFPVGAGNKTGTGAGSLAVTGGSASTKRTARTTGAGSLAVTGGSASTKRTARTTGAGSLAVTGGSATGAVTRVATAEGAVAVSAGSATGARTRSGTGAGALTVTGGSASTQRTARTTGAGAVTVSSGNASGERTASGTGAGALAVTGGSASTQRTARTTGAGAVTVTGGNASGQKQGNLEGTGEGALTVTGGSASTQRTARTTGAGAVTVTGGSATASKSTTAEGAVTVTGGSASTQRTARTTGAGAVTVAGGSASGQKAGNLTGTGEGSVTVTGGSASTQRTARTTGAGALTVTGGDASTQRTARTTAEGAVTVTGGSASGQKAGNKVGTGEGSITVTGGSASTQRTARTSGAGAVVVSSGNASGQKQGNLAGTGEGSITVTGGSATGVRTVESFGSAAIVVSEGNALGAVTRVATAEGSVSIVGGDASGSVTVVASGEGSIVISGGDATAEATRAGIAAGAVTVSSGNATAYRTAVASAEGSVSLGGGNAIARSDVANFNFEAGVTETWQATLENPYRAESPRPKWVIGGIRR